MYRKRIPGGEEECRYVLASVWLKEHGFSLCDFTPKKIWTIALLSKERRRVLATRVFVNGSVGDAQIMWVAKMLLGFLVGSVDEKRRDSSIWEKNIIYN